MQLDTHTLIKVLAKNPTGQVKTHCKVARLPNDPDGQTDTQLLVELSPKVRGFDEHLRTHVFDDESI